MCLQFFCQIVSQQNIAVFSLGVYINAWEKEFKSVFKQYFIIHISQAEMVITLKNE